MIDNTFTAEISSHDIPAARKNWWTSTTGGTGVANIKHTTRDEVDQFVERLKGYSRRDPTYPVVEITVYHRTAPGQPWYLTEYHRLRERPVEVERAEALWVVMNAALRGRVVTRATLKEALGTLGVDPDEFERAAT